MIKHSKRGLMAMLAIWLAAVTCNAPSGASQNAEETASPTQNTQSASPSAEASATAQATATPCYPMVTANTNANVRSGPTTDHGVVGSLPTGGTAPIAGRNDASTWWYIEFAGSHAWIAGSVSTATCLPSVVQVVAAPPLPTAEPTEEEEAPAPGPGAKPDLIVSEFSIDPATPVMGVNAHVRIVAYNDGNAASGQYVVRWYGLSTFASPSCSWLINNSNAHGGRVLECDFAFSSWYPINKTSLAIVDGDDQVDESNEGNNEGTISPFGVVTP